jgi:hypothetical protein
MNPRDMNENGVFDDIDETPKVVAGLVLGAVAVLVLLKAGGFRFTFSANVGAK